MKIKENLLLILCLSLLSEVTAQDLFKVTIKKVVEGHPAVESARNQMHAANLDLDAATWNFFPTPSLAYERGDKKVIGVLNQDTRYIRLQQPLWTGGRLNAQKAKAQALLKQAQSALEEQRIAATYRWLQYWAEHQSASLKIAAYEEAEKKHLEYVHQIERRSTEGFSPASDVQLSQSRLAAIRSDLRQYIAQKQQAKIKLEQMLGYDLPHELVLGVGSGSITTSTQAMELQLVTNSAQMDQISENHPTILRLQALLEATHAEVEIAKSRNVPEIYLRGEVRTGDITGTDKALYIGINSNFGAGFSNFSVIASAQAKADSAQNDMQMKKREIIESIQIDSQVFQSQSERLNLLNKNFESNRNYLLSSERQFAAGRRSWQELMNTAREEAQILTQIADAHVQVWLAVHHLRIQYLGLNIYLEAS